MLSVTWSDLGKFELSSFKWMDFGSNSSCAQLMRVILEQFKLCSRNGTDFRRVRVNLNEFELSLVHGSDFGEV